MQTQRHSRGLGGARSPIQKTFGGIAATQGGKPSLKEISPEPLFALWRMVTTVRTSEVSERGSAFEGSSTGTRAELKAGHWRKEKRSWDTDSHGGKDRGSVGNGH